MATKKQKEIEKTRKMLDFIKYQRQFHDNNELEKTQKNLEKKLENDRQKL